MARVPARRRSETVADAGNRRSGSTINVERRPQAAAQRPTRDFLHLLHEPADRRRGDRRRTGDSRLYQRQLGEAQARRPCDDRVAEVPVIHGRLPLAGSGASGDCRRKKARWRAEDGETVKPDFDS